MADVVLSTFNARYVHANLGLRYLAANMPTALREQTAIREFALTLRPRDAVEALLSEEPRVVGLGVYIWNLEQSLATMEILRRVAPQVWIVCGGPEASHQPLDLPLFGVADVVLRGEADLAFGALCQELLSSPEPPRGGRAKVLDADPPTVDDVELPYHLYSDHDLDERIVYLESSRGCPFRCEFCLSALDRQVRTFPEEPLHRAIDDLMARGARRIKFVDRTFNLDGRRCVRLLEHLGAHLQARRASIHFEVVPDHLPEPLKNAIEALPPGCLQLEAGIQSFSAEVNARVDRHQRLERACANLRWLVERGVDVHADLIAGLPGEGLESFGEGFDRLFALAPHEIQVGILKRLHGAPLARHEEAFELVFDPAPPYEVLQTSELDFATLQRLKRFARYWEIIGNRPLYRDVVPLLRDAAGSLFWGFWALSEWLFGQVGQTTGIARDRLSALLVRYLAETRGAALAAGAAAALVTRYQELGDSPPAALRAMSTAPPGDATKAR